MLAAVVNTTTLGKTILYSLAAGIGIAVIFGAGVSSAAGLIEAMRDRRTVATAAWGAAALICLLCAAGAVVLGIVLMTEKS
jgi:hypothetical protein